MSQRLESVVTNLGPNKRHIRIKIPKHSAKVVTADELRTLQLEAAAKIFCSRVTSSSSSGASTRKGSTSSESSNEATASPKPTP